MPDTDLFRQLNEADQRVATELIAREWVALAQVEQTAVAIRDGRIDGPLLDALQQQRLIDKQQFELIESIQHRGMQVDEFTVDRKIGAGAMGNVFLAHHRDSRQAVALKLINRRYADDEAFVRRFERETHALLDVQHPNIAGTAGSGRHEGLPYMAMEYVPGPSLADLLVEHGPLPENYVLRVASEVAAGLDHIYRRTHLVHRDIKPDNILTVPATDHPEADLFERHDTAKLIDFGLARSYTHDERLTMTGVTMGTPHYMSPEQIRGSQDVDLRSDIYGIGATMFHLLTGRTPYRGSSPGAVMTAHVTEPVPDPSELVPGLHPSTRSLVTMCMAKDPGDRYLNYHAFIAACHDALEAITGKGSNLRLLRKPLVLNRGRRARSKPGTASAPRPTTPGAAESAPPPATADDHRHAPPPGPTDAPGDELRLHSSERIADEIAQSPGIGVMPLLVLGTAIVALVAIVVWRFALG